MLNDKEAEERFRHNIRREYSFSEDRDKENIDKILKIQKDRHTATQAKNKAQEEVEKLKKTVDPDGEHKDSKEDEKGQEPTHSLQDIRALSDVHDDDVDLIIDWAKTKKITVAEAKKDSDLQAVLKNHEEQRKTAEASNTGDGKRGTTKVSGSALLKAAKSKNEYPKTDEGMQAMVEERYKPKS